MEDRWEKVEAIVRRVVKEELAAHGFKAKAKLAFEGGRWIGVTTDQLEAWKAAYGSCDVESELKKAAAWIISNPHLAPKSHYGRFINNWLAKQQNASSIRSIPTRSEMKKERNCAWCGRPSTGMTNGNEHCTIHGNKAMVEDPPARVA